MLIDLGRGPWVGFKIGEMRDKSDKDRELNEKKS